MTALLASLESNHLLPKKMLKDKISQSQEKGPFDNKRAKEFAEANGICIKGITGTGRDDRITISDMKKVSDLQSSTKTKFSAAAAKLAKENNIDISSIVASGKRGDILLVDVKRAIDEKPDQPLVIEEDDEPVLEDQEEKDQEEDEEPELELED